MGYSVGLALFMLLLPESPSFLLKQRRYQELTRVILEIGDSNGVSEKDMELELAQVDSVVSSKSS